MQFLRRGLVPGAFATVLAASGLLTLFQDSILAAASSDPNTDAQPEISIRWIPDPANTNKMVVEVSGLNSVTLQTLRDPDRSLTRWQKLFSIYADQGDLNADMNLPSMLGSYRVLPGAVRFEPQFPLEAGIHYRAVFRRDELPGGRGLVSAVFFLPKPPAKAVAVVSEVYPTAATVPENLLKFYVHFSAPMRGGHIYDYIHLQNEKGEEVELPFLQIDEELWDPTMTRLTLFIDPGRIKRGVRPLEDLGTALEAGHRFTLIIDRGWEDATGNQLKEGFRRSFLAGPPDRTPLDPAQWKIQSPKAGAREALEVLFPKPIDHALAERVIQVTNPAGGLIEGRTTLKDAERRWSFVPEGNWKRGSYLLVIQNTLEDLAGNNIGKPFEVDLFEGVQRQLSNSSFKLPFEVR